jgi:diguanylate cyclase (GGDEF)-like protein/PAS domain S-box-containing protein
MPTSHSTPLGLSSSTADLLAVAVIVCDRFGSARYANRAWTEMTGQVFPEWAGLGWSTALDQTGRQATIDGVVNRAGRGDSYEGEWSLSGSHGGGRTLWATALPDVRHGDVVGFVLTIVDVTEQRAQTQHLMYLATHDQLTGLYNRPQFLEFVRRAACRQQREQRCAVVLFIDVDNLKKTNDRLGHDAGDRLLRTVAARVSAAVRPSDVVARYGGDEFAVLCEDLRDLDEAASVAERVRSSGTRPSNGDGPFGLSVGQAVIDEADLDPAAVVDRADQAMYRARRQARGSSSGRR